MRNRNVCVMCAPSTVLEVFNVSLIQSQTPDGFSDPANTEVHLLCSFRVCASQNWLGLTFYFACCSRSVFCSTPSSQSNYEQRREMRRGERGGDDGRSSPVWSVRCSCSWNWEKLNVHCTVVGIWDVLVTLHVWVLNESSTVVEDEKVGDTVFNL